MLSSFAGPFMVTFFIAIFVLMMQYLWVYVDDIVGKGAGLFMLVELLSYMTVSLVPMALPIAVLISSVMVLGNLAERYELSSMKSAGIPLFRVMMPLLLACFFIAGFSFFCSDSLIPVSNLKFKSRLYDIRKQRPALSIEQGVFNDDFQDIVIRVGKKEADNETVEDVLIYDQSSIADNRLTEVIAKEGKMYTTEDGKYFVMDLFDGNQYHELKPTFKDGKQNYPFVRTSFEEWTKVFDLGAFEIQRTDEELFKSHHTMLSTRQLSEAIDTIDKDIQVRIDNFNKYVNRFYKIVPDFQEEEDSTKLDPRSKVGPEFEASLPKPTEQDFTGNVRDLDAFVNTFPVYKRSELLERSKTIARSLLAQVETTQRTLDQTLEKRIKHVFEMHSKFSLAVACLMFLFIGAPMGAIIRKGGFGYPILISIVFFVVFIILTIMCKKLAESSTLGPVLAAWMPCLVLFPIGFMLTVKAMNDSKILNADRWWPIVVDLFKKLGNLTKKRNKLEANN
jgi:lipopolysaccharide export system permease protein